MPHAGVEEHNGIHCFPFENVPQQHCDGPYTVVVPNRRRGKSAEDIHNKAQKVSLALLSISFIRRVSSSSVFSSCKIPRVLVFEASMIQVRQIPTPASPRQGLRWSHFDCPVCVFASDLDKTLRQSLESAALSLIDTADPCPYMKHRGSENAARS